MTVLTNGTLFFREDVRADCLKSDVVLPSLDAGDEETFRRINRPHADISIEKLVSGLSTFRKEFSGLIWLEVFLVAGLNTNTQQIDAIKALIEQIAPDKIHLNTAVRPTAEPDVAAVAQEQLASIAAELGRRCEVIADFSRYLPLVAGATASAEDVFSMLKRRPCSVADISTGLSIPPNLTVKHLTTLQQQGLIESYHKSRTVFFRAK